MVTTIYLLLVILIPLGYNEEVYESEYCTDSKPSDELAFVNPHPHRIRVSPLPRNSFYEGQKSPMRCCGTGFTSIEWYLNDELITDNDTRFLTDIDHRQVIIWIDPSPPGYSNISCLLIKDVNTTLLHHMSIYVREICKEPQPEYTLLPSNECASPGDTVSFWCEVFFGPLRCIHPFFRRVAFKDDNGLTISSMREPHANIEFTMTKKDDQATSVLASLTFHNVTEAQLATTYYCMPQRFDQMKVDFKFTGPCGNPMRLIRTTEIHQNATDKTVALSIAVISFVVIVVAISMYKCQRRMQLVWSNHVNPTKKGRCEYDAYIICSKDDQDLLFLEECLLPQLEKYFSLCIPDRDFNIGSVIPAEMSEYVKKCKRVLVVSSTNLLQTDYCDLSLSVAIANNIPLIFIKPNNQSEGRKKFNKLIGKRPTLSAALSVSKVLSYPTKETIHHLSSFYDSLYQAMPLSSSTV